MTIKAVVKDRELRSDGKVNIKLRITHRRRSMYFSTNQYILPEYFDNNSGLVKPNHTNADYLNLVIRTKITDVEPSSYL